MRLPPITKQPERVLTVTEYLAMGEEAGDKLIASYFNVVYVPYAAKWVLS